MNYGNLHNIIIRITPGVDHKNICKLCMKELRREIKILSAFC